MITAITIMTPTGIIMTAAILFIIVNINTAALLSLLLLHRYDCRYFPNTTRATVITLQRLRRLLKRR